MKRTKNVLAILAVIALALAAFPTGTVFAGTEPPVVSSVALSPNPAVAGENVAVTATVDDSTTGGSNIQSAEYNIDGGSFTAMSASDGAFDTPTEGVTASFAAPDVGDHQVCVRGTDANSNVSTEVCATLTVESIYTFSGFKPPIRMNMVNKASAPRTVPVKFRLTMTADGSPVSDPAAIDSILTYEVDCTSLTGDSSTAVEAKTPGKSGQRYLNKGNWIFNWKTEKSFSGTCRNLYILFSDGSTSPEVTFQFK